MSNEVPDSKRSNSNCCGARLQASYLAQLQYRSDVYKMSEIIFLKEGTAPAPSKDFYHLSINKNKRLTLSSWGINIRIGSNRLPSQSISSLQEFLEAKKLQCEIVRVFGCETLELVKGVLSSTSHATIGDLPDYVTKKICLELELCDLGHLAQVYNYYDCNYIKFIFCQ